MTIKRVNPIPLSIEKVGTVLVFFLVNIPVIVNFHIFKIFNRVGA